MSIGLQNNIQDPSVTIQKFLTNSLINTSRVLCVKAVDTGSKLMNVVCN